MFSVKVVHSLDEVKLEEWDSILPRDKIICSYNHLIAVEKSDINNCIYRYIMVYQNNKLVAHTCIYYISFYMDILGTGFVKKTIEFIRKNINKNFLRLRFIESGCPTAIGNTITILEGVNNKKIYPLLILEMEKFARENKVKILLFRDFYEEELLDLEILWNKKFKRIRNLPDSLLINNWKNYEEYMSDMRSHYRYRIRKIEKLLNKNGIKVEERIQYSDIAGRLVELWYQVYDNATEYQREILTEEYFKNMDHYMKDKSRVLLFLKGDLIVGYIFFLLDDDTARPLFIGMDYEYNKPNKLYFNILCNEIKIGINHNKKAIEMGLTTIAPKKLLGAEIVPLYAFIRHLFPPANLFLARLFLLMSNEAEIQDRRTFNNRFFDRIYTDFDIKFLYKEKITPARVNNIDERGINISCATKIEKGVELFIAFKFPNVYNSFVVKSKVMWLRKEKKKYILGLAYLQQNASINEKLNNFITYIRENNVI